MRRRLFLSLFLIAGLAFSQPARKLDLSHLVVVGDSLSAGFQNYSLVASSQVWSYANLIAQQARTPLALPLIAEPGIPNKLILVNPGPPVVLSQAPGVSSGRIDPSVQPTNLAVPGHTVIDALLRKPSLPIVNPLDQEQTLTNLVLGLPGLLLPSPVALSQVEWVERFAQNPSTAPTAVIVWVGNNDALSSVILANPALMTSPPLFAAAYSTLLQRLSATGARLVIANVPDMTLAPYLTPAPNVVVPIASQAGIPPAALYALLGIAPGDYLLPGAVTLIRQMAAAHSFGPLPATCPVPLPSLPLPATPCLLTASQIAAIRSTISAYNDTIAAGAYATGSVFVDIAALVKRLSAEGIEVGGRRLTTAYLGGLFSLDAIHPANTGQAIIANEFIRAMNRQAAAGVPPLAIEQVFQQDPLQ